MFYTKSQKRQRKEFHHICCTQMTTQQKRKYRKLSINETIDHLLRRHADKFGQSHWEKREDYLFLPECNAKMKIFYTKYGATYHIRINKYKIPSIFYNDDNYGHQWPKEELALRLYPYYKDKEFWERYNSHHHV